MSKKDELIEEGKKKIKKYIVTYGVPIICIFFGVLVTLGLIFGPGIDFGTMPATSSTPMMEITGLEDFVKEIREDKLYLDTDGDGKRMYQNVSKTKEDSFGFIPGEPKETVTVYKVQKSSAGNRWVGHELILSFHSSADDYLKEMMEDSGGTDVNDWIPADYVESAEEMLIQDLVEATYEAATNKGVELTNYQIYAIAEEYYTNKDGTSNAKNDGQEIIKKIKDYISSHGKLPDYYGKKGSVTLSAEYQALIDSFNPAGEIAFNSDLFVYGYFTRLGKYCPK